MTLNQPFSISSRLKPCLRIAGADVQLERDGETNDGRDRFRWTIDLPDSTTASGNDLRSGCQGDTLQGV